MSASARIRCILRIHDIIFIDQGEAVKTQQGLDLSKAIPKFLLRSDIFTGDKIDRFLHMVKIIVDQVRNGLGPSVSHRLKIKRTDGSNRLTRGHGGLSGCPQHIGYHRSHNDQAAYDGCHDDRFIRYLFLPPHKISPYSSSSIRAASS